MTAPGFELTSQRQKVSRLPTEPPGRPASLAVCDDQTDIHTYMHEERQEKRQAESAVLYR